MRSKLIFGPMLAAALSAPLAPTLAGKALAAADQTLGMALMSAAVAADGTPVHGAGVISSAKRAKGSNTITFNRSLSNCTATASVGRADNFGGYAGYIANTDRTSTNNELLVYTLYYDGTASDVPFQVIVFCPK